MCQSGLWPARPYYGRPRAECFLKLHGSLLHSKCTRCAWAAEQREPVDASSAETLPRCPKCGSLLRPDVVWFGEMLPPGAAQRAGAPVIVVDPGETEYDAMADLKLAGAAGEIVPALLEA